MGACTVTGTVFKYGVWRVKHRGVAVGLYYGITIIIVSLATAMTVLTLNIHHKGDHGAPVPRLIQKICFDRLLARVLCLRAYKVDEQQDGTAAVCAYMIFLLRVFSLLLPVPLPFFVPLLLLLFLLPPPLLLLLLLPPLLLLLRSSRLSIPTIRLSLCSCLVVPVCVRAFIYCNALFCVAPFFFHSFPCQYS